MQQKVQEIGSLLRPYIPPVLFNHLKRALEDPERHRRAVGGRFEELGKHQFEYLTSEGLSPDDKFLDVGCGSLRGGVYFIDYLDDGNYYGVDADHEVLKAGVEYELPQRGLGDATAHLQARDDFEFQTFNTEFDYALAQSVFTHLPWNAIVRCLINMEDVLAADGRFYATFFETNELSLERESHPDGIETVIDADPFHYPFSVFENICSHLDELTVEYIGDWDHPRDQQMMVFLKE